MFVGGDLVVVFVLSLLVYFVRRVQVVSVDSVVRFVGLGMMYFFMVFFLLWCVCGIGFGKFCDDV